MSVPAVAVFQLILLISVQEPPLLICQRAGFFPPPNKICWSAMLSVQDYWKQKANETRNYECRHSGSGIF